MKLYCIFILVFISCNTTKEISTNKKMEQIHTSNGLTINCKSLNEEEFKKILSGGNYPPIVRYKEKYEIDVYEISENKIVVNQGGYYTMFFGLADLDTVLSNSDSGVQTLDLMFGKNPYGVTFPKKTHHLISEIVEALDIHNIDTLSVDGLVLINDKINKLSNRQAFLEEKFINIIALVGEAVIKNYNVEWEMTLGDDNITWSPFIKVKGQNISFFVYLFEDIYETKNTENCVLDLYGTIAPMIRGRLD